MNARHGVTVDHEVILRLPPESVGPPLFEPHRAPRKTEDHRPHGCFSDVEGEGPARLRYRRRGLEGEGITAQLDDLTLSQFDRLGALTLDHGSPIGRHGEAGWGPRGAVVDETEVTPRPGAHAERFTPRAKLHQATSLAFDDPPSCAHSVLISAARTSRQRKVLSTSQGKRAVGRGCFFAVKESVPILAEVFRVLSFVGRYLLLLIGVLGRMVLALLLGGWTLVEWGAPRLERRTRPLRKALRRRLRNAARRARRTPVRTALAACVIALVSVNGVIRYVGGGDPGWLSTRHFRDKAVAVARFVSHAPFHAFGTCGASHQDLLLGAAREHGVPVALVQAVAQTESGFRPHAISHAGAMGMMQLMPTTAVLMKVPDPFDAKDNIRGGARYLGQLWRRYDGNIERVAAAYHAGPGAVARRGPIRVGPITRRYAKVVSRRYKKWATAQ